MKAITVKEAMMSITAEQDPYEDELIIPKDKDGLINFVRSSDKMLHQDIEPLLHSKEEYLEAKGKALKILKFLFNINPDDIEPVSEAINYMNIYEAFDVLTWSKKHMPEMIYKDIEEAHEGGLGEKFQKSLLKIVNKEELLQWYNKNFEVGQVNEEWSDQNHWNRVFERTAKAVKEGYIDSEEKLEPFIKFLCRHGGYNLSEDDIEDAAWAGWEETK